jgi:hypothetical protein
MLTVYCAGTLSHQDGTEFEAYFAMNCKRIELKPPQPGATFTTKAYIEPPQPGATFATKAYIYI